MNKAGVFVSVALAASATFFCSASAGAGQETRYPFSIENCGRTLTFGKPPSRAVADGQNSGDDRQS